MNSQLAAIIEAENEANVLIEDYLKRKKTELSQHLQVFYKKKNYEFVLQRLVEVKDQLEKRKQRIEVLSNRLENLRKTLEEKKAGFAVRKVQQRMKLEATKKHLEELQKVVKVQIKILGKQINEYQMQITNDRKRVGIMSGKLGSGISNLKLTKQILAPKYRGVSELNVPAEPVEIEPEEPLESQEEASATRGEANIYQVAEADIETEIKRDSLAEPFSKERDSYPSAHQAPSHDKDSAISEKLSVLANPSDSSNAPPKYGCINVNIADLNVTGSEAEAREEVKEEGKRPQQEEEEPGRFVYSSFNEKASKFRVDTTVCPVKELQLFDSIKTLLEGTPIYKKYTTQNLLRERAFDPLLSQKYPPDNCGFGKRHFMYNVMTNKLEFRLPSKLSVSELSIPVSSVQRVVVPIETSQIVKVQKSCGGVMSVYLSGQADEKKETVTLDKLGRNVDNKEYREQCRGVHFYPYSVLTNDARIELVADTYTIFKYTVQAINQILMNQSLVASLKPYLIPSGEPELLDEELEPEQDAASEPEHKEITI